MGSRTLLSKLMGSAEPIGPMLTRPLRCDLGVCHAKLLRTRLRALESMLASALKEQRCMIGIRDLFEKCTILPAPLKYVQFQKMNIIQQQIDIKYFFFKKVC